MPLMLIPFSTSPNFLLVTEHSLTIIENILAESVSRRSIKIPYRRGSASHLSSSKPLLLTNWARPAEGTDSPYERLYLCREDGVVYDLQIADRKLDNITRTGNLGTRIGVNFASLNMSWGFPDVFISAGNLCNGGLFSVSRTFSFAFAVDLLTTLRLFKGVKVWRK